MKTLHLAQYIVNHSQQYGPVTPMKLQKLLYYVKAWGLVADQPLMQAGFEKWDYGPVNREVYSAYKSYGQSPVDYQEVPTTLAGKCKELTDFISTCYAQFNALTLSSMTHEEAPWKQTPQNELIPVSLMRDYYREQTFAKNFPFDPDQGPFYPVESDAGHAFTLDMSFEEAEQTRTYTSYRNYLKHIERASGEYDKWRNSLLA